MQVQETIVVRARQPGLHEITGEVTDWVARQSITTGLLTVFIRHTSASLLIQENVSPDVRHDMETFFARLVPERIELYRHDVEGPDDMPAHIKGALTQTSLAIPVGEGRLLLGRYQGIFLYEHRHQTRPRELVLHLSGT